MKIVVKPCCVFTTVIIFVFESWSIPHRYFIIDTACGLHKTKPTNSIHHSMTLKDEE